MTDWERTEFERKGIVYWYRVDLDQDEIASWQDLRNARTADVTDEQITAEFNHYDLNEDGSVTFDEAKHVRTQDREEFLRWFK